MVTTNQKSTREICKNKEKEIQIQHYRKKINKTENNNIQEEIKKGAEKNHKDNQKTTDKMAIMTYLSNYFQCK